MIDFPIARFTLMFFSIMLKCQWALAEIAFSISVEKENLMQFFFRVVSAHNFVLQITECFYRNYLGQC